MSTGFDGAVVALFEARMAEETALLVRRLGGVPVLAPALAEHDVDADGEVRALIARLSTDADPLAIFLTGAAVTRVFATADRMGAEAALVEGLRRATVLARGPKPAGALGRRGVPVAVPVPPPYTTAEVIEALERLPVDGRSVTLVHYGERSEPLASELTRRGAQLVELLLYEWRLPEDLAPLSRAIDSILAGTVPVAAFTSQVQVRHLLAVAGERRDALVAAFNDRVIVGAVGPTCAAACEAAGIRVAAVPTHPKLAPMLAALASAYRAAQHGTSADAPSSEE